MSSTTCSQVSHSTLEFVRYFPRQLLTADDMRAADEYFREKLRRHNRMLHGWGVTCGCEVESAKDKLLVKVGKGYVITPRGDEICIPEDITFDLAQGSYKAFDPCGRPSPCSPVTSAAAAKGDTVYLAVCYSECNTRPVRLHPAGCGCGCDDSSCEYSRVRESYELICLTKDELPESYKTADIADAKTAEYFAGSNKLLIPSCPPCIDDCCVVLAEVTLLENQSESIQNIVDKRRPCLSTNDLMIVALAA
jgi:hypothetical protein